MAHDCPAGIRGIAVAVNWVAVGREMQGVRCKLSACMVDGGVGPAAVRAIAHLTQKDANKRFPNLRRIVLADNALVDSGTEALAGHALFAIDDLELDLARNKIGPEGALALAASPHLERIKLLNLFGNPAILESDLAVRSLQRKFGKRVVIPRG